jgi:hypothetical protein
MDPHRCRAVVALTRDCPKLPMMKGLGGSALTDAGAIALAGHCPHLATIDLEHCPEGTEAALATLMQRCRKLVRLCTCAGAAMIQLLYSVSGAQRGPRVQDTRWCGLLGKWTMETAMTLPVVSLLVVRK